MANFSANSIAHFFTCTGNLNLGKIELWAEMKQNIRKKTLFFHLFRVVHWGPCRLLSLAIAITAGDSDCDWLQRSVQMCQCRNDHVIPLSFGMLYFWNCYSIYLCTTLTLSLWIATKQVYYLFSIFFNSLFLFFSLSLSHGIRKLSMQKKQS